MKLEIRTDFPDEYITLTETASSSTFLNFNSMNIKVAPDIVFSDSMDSISLLKGKYMKEVNKVTMNQLLLTAKNDGIEIEYDNTNEYLKMMMESIDAFGKSLIELQNSFNKTMENDSNETTLSDANYKEGFKPYPFQENIVKYSLQNKRSANFSSPGSGKTIMGYMHIANDLENIDNLIVIGPKSARNAWYEEVKIVLKDEHINFSSRRLFDFSHSNGASLMENTSKREFDTDKLNIIFSNIHKFDREQFIANIMNKIDLERTALFIDEAHYLKNKYSVRHANITKISALVKTVLIFTGSPLPNGVKEAGYIPNLLWPNIDHGSLNDENFKVADRTNDYGSISEDFQKIFEKYDKETLVTNNELKPVREHFHDIEMNQIEQYLIENIFEAHSNSFDNLVMTNMSKAMIVRLMQASSYPTMLLSSIESSIGEFKESFEDMEAGQSFDEEILNSSDIDASIEAIIEKSEFKSMIQNYKPEDSKRYSEGIKLINENKGERLLVWDVFKKSMYTFKDIVEEQTDREVFIVNGDYVGDDREAQIKNFLLSKDGILIASPATIAESVSFHRHVNKAIYLFRNYVGSHWMQSKDRIHRLVAPGEESHIKELHIIASTGSSVDKHIDTNLKLKVMKQNKILEA